MTFSKTIKTLFLTLILTITLFFSQSPLVLASASALNTIENDKKLAANPTDATSNVSSILSNNDFTDTGSTTSSSIYSPSSWTLGSNDDLKNIKYGVVDLSKIETKAEDYGFKDNRPLTTNGNEEKVLMFNSTSQSAGSTLNYYQSINLDAGSFYRISVNAYTSNDSFGSIYLNNYDFDENQSKIESFNTSKNWNTYYFYVATSPYQNQTVELNLYLGNKTVPSTGYVLFDNIVIMKYSQNKFDALTQVLPENTKLVDQRVAKIDDPTANGYVDTDFSKWENENNFGEVYSENVVANFSGSNGHLKDMYLGSNFSSSVENGIALSAENGYISYKSPDIKIGKNEVYKIGFYAKGSIDFGNMNVVLSGTIPNTPEDEDDTEKSSSLTAINTNSNIFTNGWNYYAFFVKGSTLYDTTLNLTLGLGSASEPATGYIAYAYIESYKLTNEEYTNGLSVGTTATLNLANDATLEFANSAFNDIAINDDPTLPASPENWSYISGDQTASMVSGVVNTLSTDFVKYTSLSGDIQNPQTKYGNYSNNALILYNNSPSYQGYYNTSSYTISKDSYYVASVDVYMQRDLLSNTSSGAYIYFKDGRDNNLAWFRYDALTTANSWQTFKVYFHGAFQDRTVTPYLYLGNSENPTSGVVFFDNCKITTSTEDAYKAATAGAFVKKVDLQNSMFNSYDSEKNKIYAPSFWNLTSGDSSISTSKLGLIDNNNLPNFLSRSPINDGVENTNMLMIGTTVEQNYTYSLGFDYDLNAETYYKVSVDVKTLMLGHTFDPETEDEDTPYGVNITLSGIENAVATNINTQKSKTVYTTLESALNEQENVFVTYTFYLYPTEASTINIQLALGNSQQKCSGYVFFKDLEVTEIDKDTYETDIAILTNSNKLTLPESVIDLVNVEEDEDEDSESYSTNNDWWASVFTIVIALAVLVALIGFMFKRANERKKESVKVSNNYDRLETLLKDVDRRNRTTEINAKIRNLQDELKQSQRFLEEEKQNFEKEKSQYETAKEIANDTGIAIDSPQKKLNKMQKNVEELEQKVAGIELDIQVLEEEKERIKKQEKAAIEKSKKSKIIKTRK